MPNKYLEKAVRDGIISRAQYDKLPEKMLIGLVKRKKRMGTKPKTQKKYVKEGKLKPKRKGAKATKTKKKSMRCDHCDH